MPLHSLPGTPGSDRRPPLSAASFAGAPEHAARAHVAELQCRRRQQFMHCALPGSGLVESPTGKHLVELNDTSGSPGAMLCNFAVSDCRSTVDSRFAHRSDTCSSLFYSVGDRYLLDGEDGDMLPATTENSGASRISIRPLAPWKRLRSVWGLQRAEGINQYSQTGRRREGK